MTSRTAQSFWETKAKQQHTESRVGFWADYLRREELTTRWRFIENMVTQRVGGLRELRTIELGAGTGTISALMARRGANVTLLDNSEAMLQLAREYYGRMGLSATYLLADVFDFLPPEEYDLTMSFGLAEHFTGVPRTQLLLRHCKFTRGGGGVIISVPYKYGLVGNVVRWVISHAQFGPASEIYRTEHPFTTQELKWILNASCSNLEFCHSPILPEIDQFIVTPLTSLVSSVVRARPLMNQLLANYRNATLRQEHASLLDVISSTITIFAKKN